MKARFNVSAWAIRTPLPTGVLFAVLILLGSLSFAALPVTRVPNIDAPLVTVSVRQPGAAPAELEGQVTRLVEEAVTPVLGVKHVSSSVADGVSTTSVEFRMEVSTDRALNDVKDAVALIRAELPRDAEEPLVRRVDVEGTPILTYAVSNPGRSVEAISWFVDDVVRRRLQALRGVGAVERIGGLNREIRLTLDSGRLNGLGVTVAEISRQLRVTNADAAGGRSEIGAGEQAIRTLAGARTLNDLADSMIAVGPGRKLRLNDLGQLTDGATEPRRFARVDRTPVVGLQVFRSKGSSDASVARMVDAALAELRRRHPDYGFDLIDTSVPYTVGNYDSTMESLLEGALCSVMVVFLFLRDWRATVISALSLPLSILPTFWLMSLLGFSLNLVSLLAITMATGVLVDDSIVEIENIVLHLRQGKSARRAAMDASAEIGLAVMAITLTIAAIFAPVSFMGGLAGQYFKQFGLTIAIAALFSLLVARLVTPALSAHWLSPHVPHARGRRDGRLLAAYTHFVGVSVRHRWLTLMAAGLAFAASIYCTRFLPTGFIPAGDDGRLLFAVELPPGSRLAETASVTDGMANMIKQHPEVASVFVNGGTLIGQDDDVRKATLVIRLVHKSQRRLTQLELQRSFSEDLKRVRDVRTWPVQGTGQRGISLVLAGGDERQATSVAASVVAAMKRLPILVDPFSTVALDRPEVQIRPRGDLAAALGISTDAISQAIRTATIGDSDVELAKFNTGDRLIPIRVELDEAARSGLAALGDLRVPVAPNGSVPLAAVADLSIEHGPAAIIRYDGSRRVLIEADLANDAPLGLALDQISRLPEVVNLPDGLRLVPTGDAELQAEAFAEFRWAVGTGLLVVYVVLVLLFGSVLQPATILLSLPLSLGGVIAALWVTGRPVSLPVVLGILMLIGIVTKNAIMLVDVANRGMARGMSSLEAVVEAGRSRARPIVMTTAAMTAGMIPSTLALGDGGEFRSPMAIGLIGGLLASTVLSLLFVPAAFTTVDGLSKAALRVLRRRPKAMARPAARPPSSMRDADGLPVPLPEGHGV